MAYFNTRPSNFGTYSDLILQPLQMSCVTGVGNTAVMAYIRWWRYQSKNYIRV